jgi:MazG family protein
MAKRTKHRTSSSKAGGEFQRLVDTMATLRGPGGCPWDREQTLASLRPYLLEETYEVLDAIDRADHDALKGEIGDLIFEGVFLAQICADERRFTVVDSLKAVTEKLVRRHPHIYGPQKARISSERVRGQWERIKSREQKTRGERRTVLGGVGRSLPALLRAYEIGTRASAVGFDWARAADVVGKIREEVDELAAALAAGRNGGVRAQQQMEEEMGDLLFAIANLARKLKLEPESALRRANEKFIARFESMERAFEAEGSSIHEATLEQMERRWQQIKRRTKTSAGHRRALGSPRKKVRSSALSD